jgi:predicted transcriptional regulator
MDSISLKDELLKYVALLDRAEQESVLNMLKTFLQKRNTEFGPVTLDQYNKELEEADAEIEAGDYVTHEEVKRRILQ